MPKLLKFIVTPLTNGLPLHDAKFISFMVREIQSERSVSVETVYMLYVIGETVENPVIWWNNLAEALGVP